MLQKLEFNLNDTRPEIVGATTMEKDGNTVYVKTVPDHPLWASLGDKKPMVVFAAREIEPGIYETGGFNFEHDIDQYTGFQALNAYENLDRHGKPLQRDSNAPLSEYIAKMEGSLSPYGVADSVEQIKEKYKEIISSDSQIVISVTEIRKDRQPEEGGWRWHKWGEYIGTQESQCEYIADEPNINSVYVFHVYSVEPKVELTLTPSKPKMK